MLALCLALIDDPVDRERFYQLYEKYRYRMMRVACSILKDEHNAEEALDDAFFAIAKSIRRVPVAVTAADETGMYICKVVKNFAINKMHQQERRNGLVDIDTLFDVSSDDNVEENVIRAEQSVRIRRAIENLPTIYRDVMYLYYVEDMDVAEIAEVLGRPEGTVKSQLRRGRLLVQKDVGEVEW